MNVLWETMIAEMRAERLELDNRRHFTREKEPIQLVRGLVAENTDTIEPLSAEVVAAQTASALASGVRDNLFEVG